jgi:outer membrane protein TolC
VDKTRNLIVLETEAGYLKWREANDSAAKLQDGAGKAPGLLEATEDRWVNGKASVEDVIRAYALLLEITSGYNEARYLLALALTGLERATAGGFVPPFRSPASRQHP